MNRKGSLFFHFSNELDTLFDIFSDQVRNSSIFDLKSIVVPSLAAENSLKKKIAKSFGICMGFDFSSMQPIIHKMIKLFFPEVKIESHLELAIKIQLKIKEIIESKKIKSEKFAPLLNYLTHDKIIDPEKLTSLCDHLASLFVTYSLYSKDVKKGWPQKFKESWQKEVWEMVFEPHDYYYNPYQVLNMSLKVREPVPSLFIFNVSFLSKPYFLLLKHISQKVQVEFFQLSMCAHFWSDICTDFEKSVYLKRLKKRKVIKDELTDFEEYLSHSNPLLANYGKLGREWLKIVESEENILSIEKYVAPQDLLKIPSYAKWVDGLEISFDEESFTLLKALKADLLLTHEREEPLFFNDDYSIQIHQASTYQREVEILHANVIELLAKNKHLNPSDITVYISKIENYIPYLEDVFEQGENKVEITIYNVPFKVHNSALKGFFQLIDFANSRWEVSSLLQLLHHPAFKNKFGITNEIIKEWQYWIDEVGVSFGYNREDQKEHLISEYQKIDLKDRQMPSFEDLIHSLLKYLCQKHETFETIKHLSSVNFSNSDSINLLVEILNSLRDDLMILREKEMTISSWASYLESLFESYFSFGTSEKSDYLKIINCISLYRSEVFKKKESLFSFKTFYYYLKKDLNDLERSKSISNLQTVGVYSLKNSPALDSKVVYIMGLNDLEFPRQKVENPLCLLKHFSNKEYWPMSMDYDRYLFLEMIMSAKEHLYLSYLGYSTETFKEVEPSILISELLSYLDRYFILNKSKPSEKIVYHHPHLSFNYKNFMKENFYQRSFSLAQSYYYPTKSDKDGLISYFLEGKKIKSSLEPLKSIKSVSINCLCQLSRNSTQFSLNRSYQIYLEKESMSHENQNYCISSMQKALLKKRLFKNKELPTQEGFPKGVFSEMAFDLLTKEMQGLQDFLKENALTLQDFFSIELREDISTPIKISDNHWVLPCIEIKTKSLGTFKIVGVLEDVSNRGLLSHRAFDEESLFLEWPRYLVYSILKDLLPFNFNQNLIFSKSRKIHSCPIGDPYELLELYLDFYLLSFDYILPFLPKWIPYFMNYEASEIIKRIKIDLESPFFYNQYTKMLFSSDMPKELIINFWKKKALNLFEKTYSIINP